jgi:calcineurin-like phosphoesterase family protein
VTTAPPSPQDALRVAPSLPQAINLLRLRTRNRKMTTWIISDTHFGDSSFIGADLAAGKTARRFETVSQMNECLADNWNDLIASDDTVFHLGDVYGGDGWKMLGRLNGQKHLILGNHDNPQDPKLTQEFQSMAIWKVLDAAKIVLTHLPISLCARSGLGERFFMNIHGHLHCNPAPTERHICVSVEQTDYKPVNLEEFIATCSAT